MNNAIQPRIVVGLSGSRASVAALAWAAAEAHCRHADLLVVRAWQAEQLAPYTVQASRRGRGQQQEAVKSDLAALLWAAFGADEPHRLTTSVIEGTAERVLVDASAGADFLVLGSTSAPTLSGRSIGPVIRSCLSRAHCPVVVIGPEGRATGNAAELEGEPGRAAWHKPSHGPAVHHGSHEERRRVLAAVPAPRTGD